jgi:chemosensory pili system protein ChpC
MVPVAAVEQILSAASLEPPTPGAPDWLAGLLPWRGLRVPVVCLGQGADPAAGRPAARPYVVLCRAPTGAPVLPYFALASPSLPRLERVTPRTLSPDPAAVEAPGRPFSVVALRHQGQPAVLLDPDALQRALLAASGLS